MCGRYTSTSSTQQLAERFVVDAVVAPEQPPRWNVAPRASVYAVVERDARRRLELLRWGLVPSWAADPSIGDRLVNARAETAAARPAYRGALARRRCLLPADGFYEWQALPAPGARRRRLRQPWFFRSPGGEPLAVAGLWEVWRGRAGHGGGGAADAVATLRTATVLTTAANDRVAPVHDRMPALLAPRDWDVWLDPETPPDVAARLLVPAPGAWLDAWPVGGEVNDARRDGPDLVAPVPAPTLL